MSSLLLPMRGPTCATRTPAELGTQQSSRTSDLLCGEEMEKGFPAAPQSSPAPSSGPHFVSWVPR